MGGLKRTGEHYPMIGPKKTSGKPTRKRQSRGVCTFKRSIRGSASLPARAEISRWLLQMDSFGGGQRIKKRTVFTCIPLEEKKEKNVKGLSISQDEGGGSSSIRVRNAGCAEPGMKKERRRSRTTRKKTKASPRWRQPRMS